MSMFLEEIATKASVSKYDELMQSRNGPQKCRFVDYYVADPSSATTAAKRAKYSPGHAAAQSVALLNDQLVAAAIAEKMNERIERTKITQDRILQELAILAFSNIDNYSINPISGSVHSREGAPDYVMRAVSAVKFIVTVDEEGNTTMKTEIKLWDKLAALKMAGQHLGMFEERVRVNGELTVRQKWNVGGQEIIF